MLVPVIQANDDYAMVNGVREMGMSANSRNNWFKDSNRNGMPAKGGQKTQGKRLILGRKR